MSDNKMNMNETEDTEQHVSVSDYDFLQERIKERPINKRKLLKRTIITASMAVMFGMLACLSFLLLEPVLNNWLYPEEEPETVIFPPEQDEMLPEDMLTEGTLTSEETETNTQSEEHMTEMESSKPNTSDENNQNTDVVSSVESSKYENDNETNKDNVDAIQNEIDIDSENEFETFPTEIIEPLQSYQTQYEELYKVYKEVASSMVTVTAVHSDVDWFNNTYQSEGTTAGVIIANNNRELLILSKKSPLDNAETISVSFCNGAAADAFIKKYDKNTDLAVLAVDLKYIGSATLEYITLATFGSSTYSGLLGTPVIAIGNLFGYKDNVCYGMITSKGNNIYMADNEYKLITTDIYASTSPSGILVNMDKEIIGIIDNSYNNDDTKNLLSAIGITELKGMVTKLSNGENIPYLGIYAQNISSQTRSELGLPQGAYIFDIDMDSPAMLNGIQKGDILVQVGEHEIRNASDYMEALREASTEKNIKVVVRRASLDEYKEMQFMVQPKSLE